MHQGIRTEVELKQLVEDYLEFDEFVIDVETLGNTKEERLDPLRNIVFWISLAGPGRTDVIPCGHPIGERREYEVDDNEHRIVEDDRGRRHYQERVYDRSVKGRWSAVPDQFTSPPSQLWISEVAKALRPLLFSDRRKIGQNVKFDIRSMAKYYGGEIPPPPYGDTEIAARLVNENFPSYRLGDCVNRAFRFKYDKKIGKEVEKVSYSEAHTYSYLDAKYTWLLWCHFFPRLEKEGVRHVFDLEMDLLPVIIDMETAGVSIDERVLQELGNEFSLEMARLKVDIDRAAGFEVNLNANKQVATLVYETLGHPCKEFTKTGLQKTAKDVLEGFSKDPIVAAILDHAALNKLQGSFIEGIQKRVIDHKIHPNFKQTGTVSGRASCTEPNVQQVPVRSERGKRIRDVFVAGKGKVFVVADLSQIELRVLAHFTQDPKLLKAYRENLDLHSMTAAAVFGDEFTATQRSLAKNGNFSIVFGAGPGTLVRRYGFPNVKTARDILEGFYRSYRRVKPWRNEVIDEARSRYIRRKQAPYVLTLLGRKRRLPELYSIDDGKRFRAERQAVSTVVSGSAADLFKVAMLNCDERLVDTGWDAHILMTVHDELVVEVPENHAEAGLTIVKDSLETIMNPFTGEPILSVPLVADAHIVQRWSDAKG